MPDRRTSDVLTLLRTLDPAEPREAVDVAGSRARATLERILATDPAPAPTPAAPRRRRRVLLASAAAVAVPTATVVALPSLTGGDRAFATWEPTGQRLGTEQQTAAAEHCRSAQLDGPGEEYAAELDAAQPAIAETRGVWTTVVLAGADGFSALCVTDGSTHVFDDWFGSVGTPTFDTTPAPDGLVATSLGTGAIDAGELSLAAGTAGNEVTGVSYASATRGVVQATVADGYFALWLPGDDFVDAASSGVAVQVTLADGSTRTARLRL